MQTNIPGAIPNHLGEGFVEAMKAQCITLYVAVAKEKDPHKRLQLVLKRDVLRLSLLRYSNATANLPRRPKPSPSTGSAPLHDGKPRPRPAAETSREVTSWYCRAQTADCDYGSPIDIDALAHACNAAAKKHSLSREDVLAVACEAWMTGKGYDSLPAKTRINRAVSKAVHQLHAMDNFEHHTREKARLGDAFSKWTPRLTPELIADYYNA